LNDVIMVFAFAPIVGLLLGLSAITVPWDTLLLSVVIYIVVPLTIANIWRSLILKREQGDLRLTRTIKVLHPFSLAALLATLVLLFGFQGEQIICAASHHFTVVSSDLDPGFLQFRPSLPSQSSCPFSALRGRSFSVDWSE
jgi:ACR3 family arsenite efflux pump ArsB